MRDLRASKQASKGITFVSYITFNLAYKGRTFFVLPFLRILGGKL